jgi:MFS superfamily sulfate permease-like transporter
VPLLLFALYTTSQYLQVGAVAIVSLLTYEAVTKLVAPQAAAVAALKTAASVAAKAASAQRLNATLTAADFGATAAYNAANVALIQTQIDTASLLAFFVGLFSLGIGFLKLGSVMNLMGPSVISGFQTAASVTIALGQFKNLFGLGRDFTVSTHIDEMIRSFVTWEGELNTRSTWTGFLFLAILSAFKHLGRVDSVRVRGVRVMRFFKIAGPVLLCIIAIVTTKLAELYLSPGCSYYDDVKNVANIYVPSAVSMPSSWNISHKAITTTNFLGHLTTYYPEPDAPGCVPMLKGSAPVTFLNDTKTPWGAAGNPWPRERGLPIVGTFGKPPTGRVPNLSLVSGELLAAAITVTLVSSLESIAIAKALVSKHRQPNFDPSQEFVALGMANLWGSFTGSYPISGSFSRSALNDEVGATSPVSVIVVGVLVGIILKIASAVPIFYYLPQNALSAIVIIALTNLMDVSHFKWLLRHDRKDAALWLTAFLAVLFAGIEIGILIAVIISLALVVIETVFAPMPQLGLVPGSSRRAYRSVTQYPDALTLPGVHILRVEAPILFFNAPTVAAKLRGLVYGEEASSGGASAGGSGGGKKTDAVATRAVVVDFSNVSYVDSAFVEAFEDLIDQYNRADVLLAFANPNSAVLHKLTITKLLAALNSQFGEERDWIFLTVSDAVDAVTLYEPPLKPLKHSEDDDDAQDEDDAGGAAVAV